MQRDREGGTRARRYAYQRDAPDLSAGAAKTGGVPDGPEFAGRRGRGQDSSMSTIWGLGGSVPVGPAMGRATRGEARAAKRLPCSVLRLERLRHGRYPALGACGVPAGGGLLGLPGGLPIADFAVGCLAADHVAARAGAHARAGLHAPGLCAPGWGRWRMPRETPPAGGRQRHRSLRA